MCARLITSDTDLIALQDGSFDLARESVYSVARRILDCIAQRMGLDRGGIFLCKDDVLRGFFGYGLQRQYCSDFLYGFSVIPRVQRWGDQYSAYRPRRRAVLPNAKPGRRGWLRYRSRLRNQCRSVDAVCHRMIGVLAGDNFVSKRPILYDQVQALMALANQGAVAMVMAKLYHDL